ncbi:PucR family transcriptional regulator ligand-binding domain-containing protein [Actinomadura yumaensis]|uniref:PucR family transcriptional regulator ligand-binding domain-containing protein n=1 Tax=Actinomadura yumaensis TaxID=111807 RepID=UPI00360A0697
MGGPGRGTGAGSGAGPTLRRLAGAPDLGLRVLAGADLLDRPVRWVFTTDLRDPGRYLAGGELVLTGLMWRRGAADSEEFVAAVARRGAVGLAAGAAALGQVPSDVVDACERHRLPLLEVPADVSFATLTRRVMTGRWGSPPTGAAPCSRRSPRASRRWTWWRRSWTGRAGSSGRRAACSRARARCPRASWPGCSTGAAAGPGAPARRGGRSGWRRSWSCPVPRRRASSRWRTPGTPTSAASRRTWRRPSAWRPPAAAAGTRRPRRPDGSCGAC